jgi:hypothetical protein
MSVLGLAATRHAPREISSPPVNLYGRAQFRNMPCDAVLLRALFDTCDHSLELVS